MIPSAAIPGFQHRKDNKGEKIHRVLDTGGREVKIGSDLGLERFQAQPNGKSQIKKHRLIRKPNEMISLPGSTHIDSPDVILIGSGIMSSTLGTILKRLQPDLKIQLYEVTNELAQESSDGWNNAGPACGNLRTELHAASQRRWIGRCVEGDRDLSAV